MRRKLERFAILEQRNNIIQEDKPLFDKIKGKWNALQFKNKNPLTIELACGRGEYTIGLALMNKDANFIGIDIKGDRIWDGSNKAVEHELHNVAFLRTYIHDLEQFFEPNEVSEIWLTFPDPRPRGRDERRRLTYPRFLEIYKTILKPDGWFKFKTDNTDLFTYTLDVLAERDDIIALEYTMDLYNSPLLAEHFGIKTRFEKKFHEVGEDIKYLKFKFLD